MRTTLLALILVTAGCASVRPATTEQAREAMDNYVQTWAAADYRRFERQAHPDLRRSVRKSHQRLFATPGERDISVYDIVTDERAGYTAVMGRFETRAPYVYAGLVRLDVVQGKNGEPLIWRFMVDQHDDPFAAQALLAIEPDRWHPQLSQADLEYLRKHRWARMPDYLTTAFCISKYGVGGEMNPLAKAFMTTPAGPVGGLVAWWWIEDKFQGWLLSRADGPPTEGQQRLIVGVRLIPAVWNLSVCT